GAEPPRQPTARTIRIDSENTAAVGTKELHSDQTYQAETAHHHRLPERRIRQPDALQGDRPDHGERRLVVRHGVRNPGAQVDRHTHDLRMPPVRRDAIADPEPGHARPELANHSGIAVT